MSDISQTFTAIATIIIVGQLFTYRRAMRDSENEILKYTKDTNERIKVKGKVTDPFKAANRRHTQKSSSRHIIIRKSPDQIRNENYKQIIEEGEDYGTYN